MAASKRVQNPFGPRGAAPKSEVVTPRLRADALTPTARPWTERQTGQCKWPIVVAGETWMCCAPAAATYCEAHRAIAYSGKVARIPKPPAEGSLRRRYA